MLAAMGCLLLNGCHKEQLVNEHIITGPTDVVVLYKQNCMQCHGNALEGRMGAASNLQTVGVRLTKANISERVKSGGVNMPTFAKRLTKKQIEKIATWLASKK